MGYLRQEILVLCQKAFDNTSSFYQENMINYHGKTVDTGEYYTEIIAEFLLERIQQFRSGITRISRNQGYNVKHNGAFHEGSGREEEHIAIKLFNQCAKNGDTFDYIGQIIDYQTPLKASSHNRKVGKIDLLSYADGVLRILELKRPDSSETMLRCVLEGFTYLEMVDTGILLDSFNLSKETQVKAAPLVFRDGFQWQEWKEKRPMLTKLMGVIDSKPYFISQCDNGYVVTEE